MPGRVPAPYRVLEPEGDPRPILFDSPHSGRHYPEDFGAAASIADLRRGEDAYVDELIGGAVAQGITVLCATYPRCYIDLNRTVEDIDQELLAAPWPGTLKPTEKSRRGLGLIRRDVVPGIPIYNRRLSVNEVERRIETVYRPYHAALRSACDALRERHGRVWHVNWHSMKSVGNAMTPDGEGAARPDFVVGDLRGRSSGRNLVEAVVGGLRDLGYSVSVNEPYAGGVILDRLGAPDRGVHSVQVEINRGRYLDELRVEKTAGFPVLRESILRLATGLAEAMPG